MDRGRMLSLLAIRRGTFPLPPLLRRAPFCQPSSGVHREAFFPFSRLLPSVFSAPLSSSKKGDTEDLKEFVPPGSAGQVCRVPTLWERE